MDKVESCLYYTAEDKLQLFFVSFYCALLILDINTVLLYLNNNIDSYCVKIGWGGYLIIIIHNNDDNKLGLSFAKLSANLNLFCIFGLICLVW